MTIATAVILATIAATLHWKHRVPRLVCWLLLFVGVGSANVITGLAGGFTHMSIYGVGIFTIVAIFTGITFWEEAVKRRGMHRVRTPVIALVLGVSLMGVGGTIGNGLKSALRTTGQNVDKAVTTSINGK